MNLNGENNDQLIKMETIDKQNISEFYNDISFKIDKQKKDNEMSF